MDRDGILNSDEILQMIHILLLVAKESNDVTWHKNINNHEIFDEIIKFSMQTTHNKVSFICEYYLYNIRHYFYIDFII